MTGEALALQRQDMDAEIIVGVGPYCRRSPARAARQRTKRVDRIFIAVLGVDGFAGAKLDALAAHLDALALEARQVHLDARTVAVKKGMMLEAGRIEFGVEFAIDACQQIEIELRRHALRIVIGFLQN